MTDPRVFTGAPVRSYETDFDQTETPISESGMWVNGLTDGLDWADVVTEHGGAHGGRVKMGVAERHQFELLTERSTVAPVGFVNLWIGWN